MKNFSIKLKLYLIIMMAGIIIMLQVCMYEKMTYLSEDDLDWMSNICKGDRQLGFITNFDRRYSNYNCHIDVSNNPFDEFVHFKNMDSNIQNYLVVDERNSKYSRYDKNLENKITRYVINKSYGLVYYESEDGEKFFRKFD